ncbi:MAG: Magnesium transporter MgtE [Chloroflexi bacterium]|nr:Magnesium transporter MgtE [Chloroflexota bacterium]
MNTTSPYYLQEEVIKELTLPEIRELIQNREWRVLKKTLSESPAPDIADLWESLDEQDMFIVFRLLPRQLAADVFNELDPNRQISLLGQMRSVHVRAIISELSPDDRTDLFEELPGEMTQKLLNLLPSEIRKESLTLLGYPKDSVGRLMTPHYVAIRPQWTVERALGHIRHYGHDAETIDMVYVVDERWHLIDEIPLRRLILTDPQQKIESAMDRRFVSVLASDDQKKAVEVIQRYNLVALSVVDSENVLLGIVTVDDILDVLQEETTEDIQKGASVVPLGMSYSAASVWTMYRSRILWLILLTVASFIGVGIIAAFEEALLAVVALAFFIPLVIHTGGKAGTQAATLVVRAIAIGELTPKKWFGVIKKELCIGLLLGITLGTMLSLFSYFWLGEGYFRVGLVVGMSVTANVLWATLTGSMLPLILTKIRLDPAVISSPLITTMVDVIGVLIYFSIAVWWLKL